MTTPEEYRHLSDAQIARVEALEASRKVQHRSDGFVKTGGPEVVDLVIVAQFILTGQDPWAPENTKHTDPVLADAWDAGWNSATGWSSYPEGPQPKNPHRKTGLFEATNINRNQNTENTEETQ